MTALPLNLCASRELFVYASPITTIPRNTRALTVDLRGVKTLETIEADWRDLSGLRCEQSPALTSLPPGLQTVRNYFLLDGCAALTALPDGLSVEGPVSVGGCRSLRRLPSKMPPPQSLELGLSGLESIPKGWAATKLTWHRRVMTERQLFQTDTFKLEDLLAETDQDLRRILLDRYSIARLVSSPHAVVIEEVQEGGVGRRLIRVALPGHDPIVALVTKAPGEVPAYSRLPPTITNVPQAVASLEKGIDYMQWRWGR